jgi:hypothetical protein
MIDELPDNLIVIGISVFLFLGIAYADGYIVLHEAGHSATCTFQGGNPDYKQTEEGPSVTCLNVENSWNQSNLGLFFIGGILAEAILAATLLIHRLTRILGGLSIVKILGTLVFTHGYSHDLTQLGQVIIQ